MYLARSRLVRLHLLESLPGFCRPTLMDTNQILVYRNWTVLQMPDIWWCGLSAIHMHTLSMRHNKIHDIIANWINEVCHNVNKEPALQPLTGDTIIPQTANRQDNARADIQVRGFGGQQQCVFFDITVFHPNAQSYRHSSIPAIYWRHEQAKKREHSDRKREVESAYFTPLVFATTGGTGREATVFYSTSILQTSFQPKTKLPTVQWHPMDAPYPFLSLVDQVRFGHGEKYRVEYACVKGYKQHA